MNRELNAKSWEKWTHQNFNLFVDLVDGANIAISLTGNNNRIILLKKEDNGLNVCINDIKNFYEIENHADLMFNMGVEEALEILEDPNAANFIDLLCSGKIEVYELISKLELIEKRYNIFLYRLGLKLEGLCSCD